MWKEGLNTGVQLKYTQKKSNMKAFNIHEERQWECIREQPWGVEAL